MKKMYVLILFQLSIVTLNAQLHDNIWLTGVNTTNAGNHFDSFIEFDTFPPKVLLDDDRYMSITQCGTTISDENGNLLFYTNCFEIANAADEMMENGDSLNMPNFWTYLYNYGSLFHQGVVALPDPGNSQQYYLVHISPDAIGFEDAGTRLLFSKIDMAQNGGMGAVTQKNVTIVEDTLMVEGLTAVRHANGRDWWLLVFEFRSPRLYRILVTEQGISLDGEQVIDVPVYNHFGQNVFTPDGEKFIITPENYDAQNRYWIEIFDFDRCTGLLSNRHRVYYSERKLLNPANNTWYDDHAWGCAVSPNSRFVYLFLFERVIQIDLFAPDIQNSQQVVANYDGFMDEWYPYLAHSWFGLSQLAPDGKIYANTAQPTDHLHVVEKPNDAGVNAFINQHGLDLPGVNWYAMPNHPNYRLQPLEGSSCDTLGMVKNVFIHAHPYHTDGCIGGGAHFEVTAFGTWLSYQWQVSIDEGINWTELEDDEYFSGVHTEYLTLHDIPASLGGSLFRCAVSGTAGTDTSRFAELTLLNQLPAAAFDYLQDKDSLYFQSLAAGMDYIRWYFGDGDSTLLENPSHLYKSAGIYAATLVAANACGSDTFVQEIIISELQADFSADKVHGCAPLTVKFKSNSPYRVSNHKYIMPGGSPAAAWSSSGKMTTTYYQPGVYDVTLLVFTPMNAETDTLVLENYITVEEGINPVADIEVIQSGDTVQLNCPFDAGDNYTWVIDNGDTLSGQNASYVFGTQGVHQVVLEVSNHCGTATGSLELLVGELSAGFTSNVMNGCAPLTVQFEDTTQFAPDSVHWHFDGGQPSFSNEPAPSVLYDSAGVYDVMLIAFAGSFSDTVNQSAGVEVFSNDCPQVHIEILQDNLAVQGSTDCETGSGYTWYMGDGTILSGPEIEHDYDTSGVYGITLIVEQSCGADTVSLSIEVETVLPVAESENGNGLFHVVPNPAKDHIEVWSEQPLTDASLIIVNTLGETVLEIRKKNWQRSETISVSGLPPGGYFYRLVQEHIVLQTGKLFIFR
jgi:PKD repeat protein